MWVFTTFGFFSIHVPTFPERQPHVREVRARQWIDLEHFRDRYCPGLGPTIETPHSDYPYRAQVDAVMLADAMAAIVKDLQYSNFKDTVEDQQRHGSYLNVWAELREGLDPRYHRVSRRR